MQASGVMLHSIEESSEHFIVAVSELNPGTRIWKVLIKLKGSLGRGQIVARMHVKEHWYGAFIAAYMYPAAEGLPCPTIFLSLIGK